MKIMTVIGTRPEIIKMSCVIEKLDKFYEQILVHTGQNYDYSLNKVFFDELNVREPNYFLNAAGTSPVETISKILVEIDRVLDIEKPDAFLVYGDTNSCLSVIAAKRRQIPIFHFEAGNRCFDLRVPEEINRKIVDHTADINFVLSEHARAYLTNEGINSSRIFKTGSHMFEVIARHEEKITHSDILARLDLVKSDYFLVSLHREENVDKPEKLKKIVNSLEILSEEFKKRVIISTHPRTKKHLSINNITCSDNIMFLEPFGFFEYCKLQKESFCTLSDSGTITEEATIIGFPAVMLREMHERPEGTDVAAVPLGSLESDILSLAVKLSLKTKPMADVDSYSNIGVSDMIVRNLSGYIGYVNREVWKK